MAVNESVKALVENGWTYDAKVNGVRKALIFEAFAPAFQFMSEVAEVAESLNHHPDWRNVYSRVEVLLTTHDQGGVTDLDVTLGASIDALSTEFGGKPFED